MFKTVLFLGLFPLFSLVVQATYPIYIVLTHPRATATAFERVFRQKGELQVLHAPFLPAFLLEKYGPDHELTYMLGDHHGETFDQVRASLLSLAERGPVFFKESGYLLLDDVKAHPEFYLGPDVRLCILVRDPARSVLSFYKKMPSVDPSILGQQQLWELYLWIEEQQGVVPLVIDSDRFLQQPLALLNRLGEVWGLEFALEDLLWEPGFAADWRQRDWYTDVALSEGLLPCPPDVVRDEDGTPAYLEVADEADRWRLQDYYWQMQPYYEKLLECALTIED